MNLVLDIGNTNVKAAIFNKQQLKFEKSVRACTSKCVPSAQRNRLVRNAFDSDLNFSERRLFISKKIFAIISSFYRGKLFTVKFSVKNGAEHFLSIFIFS